MRVIPMLEDADGDPIFINPKHVAVALTISGQIEPHTLLVTTDGGKWPVKGELRSIIAHLDLCGAPGDTPLALSRIRDVPPLGQVEELERVSSREV